MGGQKIRSEVVMLSFGKNLKKARKEQSLTQEDLARNSGIALSQISRIETGKLNITISTIALLATALKVSPERLVAGMCDHLGK